MYIGGQNIAPPFFSISASQFLKLIGVDATGDGVSLRARINTIQVNHRSS